MFPGFLRIIAEAARLGTDVGDGPALDDVVAEIPAGDNVAAVLAVDLDEGIVQADLLALQEGHHLIKAGGPSTRNIVDAVRVEGDNGVCVEGQDQLRHLGGDDIVKPADPVEAGDIVKGALGDDLVGDEAGLVHQQKPADHDGLVEPAHAVGLLPVAQVHGGKGGSLGESQNGLKRALLVPDRVQVLDGVVSGAGARVEIELRITAVTTTTTTNRRGVFGVLVATMAGWVRIDD